MRCFRAWLLSASFRCCLHHLFIACCIGFTPRSANSDFVTPCGNRSRFFTMRKLSLVSLITGVALAGLAGCAQIKKPPAQARAVPTGLRFDQVGSVTLFPGEPCTPQIMFNFQGAGSAVWLGAPKQESRILTAAAKNNRRVHVSGKWRHGAQSNCSYVEVTSAELTK